MRAIYSQRLKRLQKAMSVANLDAVLLSSSSNIHYATGYLRSTGGSLYGEPFEGWMVLFYANTAVQQPRIWALLTRDGRSVVLVPRPESGEVKKRTHLKDVRGYRDEVEALGMMKKATVDLGLDKPTIGVEKNNLSPSLVDKLKKAFPKAATLKDAAPMLAGLRAVKAPEEIRLMEKTAQIADIGMAAAVEQARNGASEIEIMLEAEYAMRAKGAERVVISPFVTKGLVATDIQVARSGYWADMNRTVSTGATEAQRKLYAVFLDAQRKAVDELRPGLKISEVDNIIYGEVEKVGYSKYFPHASVHGVGLDADEPPWVGVGDVEVKPNMVLAVGNCLLFDPEIGAVRVEDTVLVTEKGARKLTQSATEL